MDLKHKIGIGLSYLMHLSVAIMVIMSATEKNYGVVVLGVLALIIMSVPSLLKRKFKITLPWTLNFLIAFSLFLHIWGFVGGWYDTLYPFYDKFGHFIGSFTIALLGFTSVLIIDRHTKVELTNKSIIFFVIIFTLAVGTIWEIGEFSIDKILGTTAQDSLDDTMIDLVFDLIGGVVAGGIGYVKLRKGKEKFIDFLLKDIGLKRINK